MSAKVSAMVLLMTLSMVKGLCIQEAMEDTKSNFVKHKLEGNWTFNPTLSELLGPDSAKSYFGQMIISIEEDEAALEAIPEDNCKFLAEKNMKIFMAGILRFYHVQVLQRP